MYYGAVNLQSGGEVRCVDTRARSRRFDDLRIVESGGQVHDTHNFEVEVQAAVLAPPLLHVFGVRIGLDTRPMVQY
jgi:hypothetical protein